MRIDIFKLNPPASPTPGRSRAIRVEMCQRSTFPVVDENRGLKQTHYYIAKAQLDISKINYTIYFNY